jgi:hypothetical protein
MEAAVFCGIPAATAHAVVPAAALLFARSFDLHVNYRMIQQTLATF